MKKTYVHLNKEERRVLAALLERGVSLRSIARQLNRSHSSLSRELRRNLTAPHYHPLHAEYLARLRHQACHRRLRLKSMRLRRQVEAWLHLGWSPEIIAGRLARKLGAPQISHEAIYQWVYSEARHLIPLLLRRHSHRGLRKLNRSRSRIPGRTPVDLRPQAANLRQEPGHWEVDLVVGKGRAALQVAVERKTRFTRLAKVQNKSPLASYHSLSRIFASTPQALRKSVTYDNGIENALHLCLNARFHLQSYFCAPSRWWQKPTVENTNGLIRRFLPKSSNFDTISNHSILAIQSWLNSRPRKCLLFLTPSEAFHHASGALTP